MSNQHLGTIYNKVIEDVVENCQTTFEEDGVSHQTLQDLKSTWQSKLSALRVGQFPWEPPPAPQPMPIASMPAGMQRGGGHHASNGAAGMDGQAGQPGIKTEPGYEPGGVSHLPPNYGNNDAKERAMANLQQKFGANANQQISQIQKDMLPNEPPKIQAPTTILGSTSPTVPGPPKVEPSQTDGAGEWEAAVEHRRQVTSEATASADSNIREHIERGNQSLEGGGLLLPLSEQERLRSKKRRRVGAAGPSSTGAQRGTSRPSQFDGADDDDDDDDDEEDSKDGVKDELFDDDDDEEDDDNDAINSDLDDPDENEIEEEEDEGKPTQVMLCTYDKVQRVKNKWKCTLRDGVLNSGGKEYVFSKANGEFEW